MHLSSKRKRYVNPDLVRKSTKKKKNITINTDSDESSADEMLINSRSSARIKNANKNMNSNLRRSTRKNKTVKRLTTVYVDANGMDSDDGSYSDGSNRNKFNTGGDTESDEITDYEIKSNVKVRNKNSDNNADEETLSSLKKKKANKNNVTSYNKSRSSKKDNSTPCIDNALSKMESSPKKSSKVEKFDSGDDACLECSTGISYAKYSNLSPVTAHSFNPRVVMGMDGEISDVRKSTKKNDIIKRNTDFDESSADEVLFNLRSSARRKNGNNNMNSNDNSGKKGSSNLKRSTRKNNTVKRLTDSVDGNGSMHSDDGSDAEGSNKSKLYTNRNTVSDERSDYEILSNLKVKKMNSNKHVNHENHSDDETLCSLKKRKETKNNKISHNKSGSSKKEDSSRSVVDNGLSKVDASLIMSSKVGKCDSGDDSVLVSCTELNTTVETTVTTEKENCEDIEIESDTNEETVMHDREMKTTVGSDKENCEDVEIESDMDEEVVIRARVLSSNVLDGQSIYGFVTPKRKDALAKIAKDVIESSRKSSRKKSSKKSSKLSVPKSSSKKTAKDTIYRSENDGAKESDAATGRKMRNRVTLAHTLAANDSDESGDGEEDSENDESDSDESTEASDPKKTTEDHDLLDEYFQVHSKIKSVTSDKTLAKLKQPKMDQQELLQHLKDIQSSHVQETLKLHIVYHDHFEKWMFQLLSGFNVLLYGLGSKQMLLEKFRKKMLKDTVHLVINGYFPSIQLKQILKMITGDILERETSFKNTIAHYKYITDEYDSGTAGKLYIILHNIDGHMLRSQNVQTALGHIASSRNIHIIASIDHINAPLIWDQNRASAFNWVWYDVTTFESYSEETSYENSLMVQQSGTLALSSLKHVLHSLTSNAKGIFRLVADYHLDNEDNTSYQGISFNDLYHRCRERFLVNSDLALRGQLTEFKDHKLIKTKKGYDGVEYLSVALDCATLKMFLEQEDS